MIFNTSLTQDQIKALYEFTRKKLISSGKTDTISSSPSTYLVLASPKQEGEFYSVGVFSKSKRINFVIPLQNIIFENKVIRIGKGKHEIKIVNLENQNGYTKIGIEILS